MSDKINISDAPGLKSYLDISEARPDEQSIIRKFGRIFQIGFFRRQTFKEVIYSFIFGKPTQEFNLKFNLENEILILFNNLDNFETRTFDYVDKLLSDYYNRLDKFCIVIVSNDDRICDKIERLNAKELVSRIIVPFTYNELLDPHSSKNFIENRFKKFFYARDLYDFDSPIQSASFFFGRSRIVQSFYDKYQNSENSALFGLRKIGKTSVLYALRRLCEGKDLPVIYIDCQSPSFHKRRWYEALQFIIEQGTEQLTKISKDLFYQKEYNEKDAAKLFASDIVKLRALKGNKKILLIFDEIENITYEISPSKHWKNDDDFLLFWQTIRSIFQSNRDLLSFVIAGVNPKVLEQTSIDTYDNPIFKIATPQYLELFDLETTKEMVSKIGTYMGILFEEEVFFLLHEDFGGHPFLTRIACSNINKLYEGDRPIKVTKYWYKNNRDAFSKNVQNYVEQLLLVLKNFYTSEYEMLEILASGDHRRFSEFVNIAPSAASHLEGYGLVNFRNEEYYFKIKIVEDYLNSTSSLKKFFNTLEEKRTEISKRRNAIETRLRNLAVVLLTAKYGTETKKRILNAVPTERREKIEHLPIQEILSEQYFFLDLLQLYVKEFYVFENIFEKQSKKFYEYMIHINDYRIDAHAKEIDEEEFQLLLTQFNWVEKCLAKVKI